MSHITKNKDKGEGISISSLNISLIPDFGPVDIEDYNEFMKKSKQIFIDKWSQKPKQEKNEQSSISLKDIRKLKLIGSGSFGKVYLVENKITGNILAMKAISKQTVIKYKQFEHTQTEKKVLSSNNCPFTLRLVHYFIDNSYIYFIVPFMQGGELYGHLQRFGKFDEMSAVFYISQVILALEYLHYMDIIYRDLKPENILVDHTGYIKLADFGFCKRLTKGRTYTLCGTPEYLAPEVILSKGYGKAVDWWGVGILSYELVAGFTPFRERKALKVYEKVLKGTYKMPLYFSEDLKDLIRHILQADNSKRYGNLKNGTGDFKEHKWFRTVNWQAIASRKYSAPFIPKCNSSNDTQFFREFSYHSLQIASENMFSGEFEDF